MTVNCDKCGFPLVDGHKCPTEGVGMRHNAGKARTDLIPAAVLMELGKHYEYGARKYAPNNWVAGFPYSDTYASLTRHLFAWWAGERNDPENGHHHLVAVIWNAVTLLYFELFPDRYTEFDDRVIDAKVKVSYRSTDAYKYEKISNTGRLAARDVPYDPEYVPMNREEWEKLYMGKIPPTVPIPEGFAMLRDGDVIQEGDMYMTQSHTWANALHEDFGTEYNAERMGTPMIRKFADIPVSSPCIIPEGYHELFDKDTVKENDLWLDPSIMNWVAVPKTPKFVGYYHNVKRLALRDGQEHFFVIRRDNE